jgi:hypothetical protein
MNRDPRRNSEGYMDLTVFHALSNVTREERCREYRPLIYICSPFAGDIQRNIENARRYCSFAVGRKTLPIAPHILFPQFLNDNDPEERKLGLRFGIILLDRCEAVWVFGSRISEGMAAEIKHSKRKGIPVKYFNTNCEEICK